VPLNLPGPGPLVRLVPKAETAVAAEPVETFIAADLSTAAAWWFDEFVDDVTEEFHAELVTVVLDVVAVLTAGPPASDEVQAAQDYNEDYYHDDEAEDAWAAAVLGFPDQVLDVVPQLFPPTVAEPIETFVAQPIFSEHDYDTLVPEEIEDYLAPPEQVEFLAPPEVGSTELLAAQPYFEDFTSLLPDETDDYANDVALDRTASFAQTPVETFATQPAPDHDFDTLVQDETEDYQPGPEQLEFLAPPEVPSTELLAAQPTEPHPFDTYVPDEQTVEDWGQVTSLDVSALTPAPTVVYDSLDRADSGTLGTADSGQTWSSETGAWTISGNQAVQTPGTPDARATIDLGSNDQTVEADLLHASNQQHVLARFSATPTFFIAGFQVGDNTLYLFKYVAGYTQLGTYAAGTHTGRVKLTCIGTTITVYLDEVQRIQVTDSTVPSANLAGIFGNGALVDNFGPVAGTSIAAKLAAIAQPHFGESALPVEETEDYANDVVLDITAALFSVAVEPVETFASQPLSEQPWFPDTEVEDYQAPAEQLEFLAPPEVPSNELLASQPHFGEYLWLEQETEDYANESSLDLTASLFPTALEPVETFAAQPLAEQAWFPDTELEDYLAPAEQLEFLAPPEVGISELAAAQPHSGEAFWPELETEDYQADSSIDLTPTFFPTAVEAIETFAAQPHYGEWWWEEQQTEDYIPPDDVSWFLATPLEAIVAGYDFHPEIEAPESLEDYQHTSTLDVSALIETPMVSIAELVAANYFTSHGNVEALETEGLTVENDSTLSTDLTFFIITLGLPGLPVQDPQAVLTGEEGSSLLSGIEGTVLLIDAEGSSVLTGTEGLAVLIGEEGTSGG